MASSHDATQVLAFIANSMQADANKPKHEDVVKAATMALLGELGASRVGDDSIQFTGLKVILPAAYDGRIPEAIAFLEKYHASQEKTYSTSRTFRYRPWDGAAAFERTMIELSGTAGIGKDTYSFFEGKQPPKKVTIDTGVSTTMQVPWGQVEFPLFEATFVLDSAHSREFGLLFELRVEAKRKYSKQIDGFFQKLEENLKKHSIYKGKAITGAEVPLFIDTSRVKPEMVVYSGEVLDQLDANLWSVINHTSVMRNLGMPIKRSVLVEGPYGTGKTLAGMLTAQAAERNGWTFILCRPEDDLFNTLKTAQVYAPAVVWFEDIDTVATAGTGTEEKLSKLLDALDGVTSKGAEVLAGFTTNHVDRLQKGVMRPGRLDAIVHIAELDAAGFEKLIKVTVPPNLLGEVDYVKVAKAMHGFLPAFVTEACNRALRYAIARTHGNPEKIVTDDLEGAAFGLQRQLKLMNEAKEGANTVSIDSLLVERFAGVVNASKLNSGDYSFEVDDEKLPDLPAAVPNGHVN